MLPPGSVPGPIAFGSVIDLSCLLWQDKCGEQGSCYLYQNSAMSQYTLVTGVIYKVISTLYIDPGQPGVISSAPNGFIGVLTHFLFTIQIISKWTNSLLCLGVDHTNTAPTHLEATRTFYLTTANVMVKCPSYFYSKIGYYCIPQLDDGRISKDLICFHTTYCPTSYRRIQICCLKTLCVCVFNDMPMICLFIQPVFFPW